MKFLHTSDWHLGMTFRGGISYGEDQKHAIEDLCRIAQDEKVNGILIAGDIFDKSIASQEAIKLYDEIITHICLKLSIPVYIIAGNHDGAERLSQCSSLLENSGLYIAGTLKREPYVYNRGDVDIFMLPWISTDKVKSIFPEEADCINDMEDAYRIVLNKYRETFKKGHKNLLMAHAFIVNASTSTSDRAAEVGFASMVPADVFEGFDYVALGHLHGPQQIRENIRYSGSIMPYSFGKEESQVKSVTIIDMDSLEQKILPLSYLHKRLTISGTFNELMNNSFDEDILNAYTRLEITDSFVGMDLIVSLRKRFPNVLEVSGKSLEREDSAITMTIEELDENRDDVETVFKKYCEDILEEEPDEHMFKLFFNALKEYEKEVVSQ